MILEKLLQYDQERRCWVKTGKIMNNKTILCVFRRFQHMHAMISIWLNRNFLRSFEFYLFEQLVKINSFPKSPLSKP